MKKSKASLKIKLYLFKDYKAWRKLCFVCPLMTIMSQTLKTNAPILSTFIETYKLEMQATPTFTVIDANFMERIKDTSEDSFGVHLKEVAAAVLEVAAVITVDGSSAFTIEGIQFTSKDHIELLMHIVELKCMCLLVTKCSEDAVHLYNSYTEFTRAVRRADDIIKLAFPILDTLPF